MNRNDLPKELPGRLAGYFYGVFVGKEGSLGLKKGKQYPFAMFDNLHRKYGKNSSLILFILDGDNKIACPYGSFKAFFDNWDFVISPKFAEQNMPEPGND